jgi:hypothetical protein
MPLVAVHFQFHTESRRSVSESFHPMVFVNPAGINVKAPPTVTKAGGRMQPSNCSPRAGSGRVNTDEFTILVAGLVLMHML